MDDEQLSALEEELRRDLEALSRVRGMIASKAASLKKPDERQLPLKMRPTLVENPEDQDNEESDGTSLRGAIFKAISGEGAGVRWTTQKVFAALRAENYPFQAKKPLISVGQALKALVKQEKIRVTKKGIGSAPNIYKLVEKPTTTSTEGDSAPEQALAG
jgi:hypothetical protein